MRKSGLRSYRPLSAAMAMMKIARKTYSAFNLRLVMPKIALKSRRFA
jgi:hypothetical protein